MASNTPNLDLYKKDPVADASDTFNIGAMLNDNWDKIDARYGEAGAIVQALSTGKANKPTIATDTLSASWWSNKTYSFESQYPNATYDIEIEPGSSCTEAQLSAWTRAKLVGSATQNVVKAVGEVPTVNIPIIIKVVRK